MTFPKRTAPQKMPSLNCMTDSEHIPPRALNQCLANNGYKGSNELVNWAGEKGQKARQWSLSRTKLVAARAAQSGRGHQLSKLFCYVNRLAEITTLHRLKQSPRKRHILSLFRPSSALLLQLGLTPIIHQPRQRRKSEYSTPPNRCHLDKHYEVGNSTKLRSNVRPR